MTVGVVSPGAMGSAIANALLGGGARVVATLEGRSDRTSELARHTEIELLPDLESVVREADVVLSIVPPGAALRIASDIAAAAQRAGTTPLVADLNAIAPSSARGVQRIAASAGCDLVDGSISGPPPWDAGTTRMYLSGTRVSAVAALPFLGVETVIVGTAVGSASAVKMSTASVYKGTSALVLQALRAAHENGVLEHVLADLHTSAPELVAHVERRLALAAAKSHRYVGEMHEIAAAQADAGLTPTLFEAMAQVYEELARTPLAHTRPEDVSPEPSLDDTLERLR